MSRNENFVLAVALGELANQYCENIPEEVLALFPRWLVEVPTIICEQSVAQLRQALGRLEVTASDAPASSVGFRFARSMLQAAIEARETYDAPAGGVPPVTVQAAFVQRASMAAEAELLLPRVMSSAPHSMRQYFPDFEAELRAALGQPVGLLRAAAARLEAAHADLEVQRFTEDCLGPEESLVHESQAMCFAVRAMNEVVHAKSAAEIAATVAAAIAARASGLPVVSSTRDGHAGRPDPSSQDGSSSRVGLALSTPTTKGELEETESHVDNGAFRFRSLQPSHLPGDIFNPCCDGLATAGQDGEPNSIYSLCLKSPPNPCEKMPIAPLDPDTIDTDDMDMRQFSPQWAPSARDSSRESSYRQSPSDMAEMTGPGSAPLSPRLSPRGMSPRGMMDVVEEDSDTAPSGSPYYP